MRRSIRARSAPSSRAGRCTCHPPQQRPGGTHRRWPDLPIASTRISQPHRSPRYVRRPDRAGASAPHSPFATNAVCPRPIRTFAPASPPDPEPSGAAAEELTHQSVLSVTVSLKPTTSPSKRVMNLMYPSGARAASYHATRAACSEAGALVPVWAIVMLTNEACGVCVWVGLLLDGWKRCCCEMLMLGGCVFW